MARLLLFRCALAHIDDDMTGRKILILEDDAVVANAYAEGLRVGGHHVIVCTGFEEARQSVREDCPDGVLTDIRVGQYNGLQLALLFHELCPKGVIVVVTGHDDPVIRSEVAALNAEFLVKPISLAQLRDLFSAM